MFGDSEGRVTFKHDTIGGYVSRINDKVNENLNESKVFPYTNYKKMFTYVSIWNTIGN